MQNRFFRPAIIALAVAAPLTFAFAQKKGGKVAHPNLAAAEKLCTQAYAKLEAAQKANEYDLGGHAAKAKDLIKQAQDEIKLATAAAEEHKEEKKDAAGSAKTGSAAGSAKTGSAAGSGSAKK